MTAHIAIPPPSTPVPVLAETDVLVVGGGTAGVAAALAAARAGARTIVAEGGGCLGGTMTAGLIDGALSFTRFSLKAGRPVRGILAEIIERLWSMGGMGRPVHRVQNLDFAGGQFPASILEQTRRHDPQLLKIALVQMLDEAGVQVLLRSQVDDVLLEEGRVKGVFLATKAGRRAILAKVTVDATGDADVAAFSGAQFEVGHPDDGHTEAISLIFRLAGIDESRYVTGGELWFDAVQRAVDAGELRLPDYVVREKTPYNLVSLRPGRTNDAGVWLANIDQLVDVDPTDPWQLSRAQNEGMKRVWEYIQFLRKYIPGCEQVYLVDTAELIGVRDSRRIVGDYLLTWHDLGSGRKFPDAIASSAIIIDLHDHHIGDREGEPVPRHLWTAARKPFGPPPGDWYDVPFRSLLPRGLDNLVVAGRCISTDYQTVGATRLIPICIQTGQAAGAAAALAARNNLTLRELEVSRLQAELLRQGADLTISGDTNIQPGTRSCPPPCSG